MDKYNNVENLKINKKELLKHVFFVAVPTMNMEGYESVNRCTGAGHDANRDEANQAMVETANYTALMNKFNPIVYNETHGRVKGMVIEPCTPPHEPNFEYDLYAGMLVKVAEALGNGAISNSNMYNSYEMPSRDYLHVDEDSPTGVKWDSNWDDMTPGYGSSFSLLIGSMGITWEMPAYNEDVSTKVVPYGVVAQGVYIKDHKMELVKNQAMVFERGVKNVNSKDKVGLFYVDQYDRPAEDKDTMRPIHNGESENQNFFAEAFIIPMDADHQTNLEAAAIALKYLTRNEVKVHLTTKEFSYKGVTYPKGTMIVSMYQANRSLAHSQLFSGTFISIWGELYADSFSQQPYARGYDILSVTEPKEYGNIIQTVGEAMTYESALKYLETFSSQFRGAEDKDVIIENASLDSALAINNLIKAGKKVGVITGGKDKTDFIVSYEDYKSIADQYILSAYGVDGTNIKAKLIGKSPVVYVPSPWTPNDGGYSGFSDWSYEYNFDSYALQRLGFDITKDVTKSDAIVGQNNLEENEIADVKAGKPYMAIGNAYETRDGVAAPFIDVIGSGKISKCQKGIDFMGYVEYPVNTMVNGSYAK